ncbi:MAG TPA: class I SAM-dependent methyltransferase [Ferruginibacter sp.]|nr:class I SAM-dependent methyltransferase [Ferruginibacter sp.]
MKDNFSHRALIYAQYRPHYPEELFAYIMRFVEDKKLAWDCGTGNGQSARSLSNYFEKIIATDISQKQIDNAYQAPNIFYVVEPAEKTGIEEKSVNLVTVAQAIHWFNFEKFYAEVNRVAKPGAVIAAWTYSLLRISKEIDELMNEYHYKTLKNYWDPERKYVDEGYAGIPFPFTKIETPGFHIEANWCLEELEGYLNSWSALQKFIAANSYNPVNELVNKIRQQWGHSEKRQIFFPVHLKLGIIE